MLLMTPANWKSNKAAKAVVMDRAWVELAGRLGVLRPVGKRGLRVASRLQYPEFPLSTPACRSLGGCPLGSSWRLWSCPPVRGRWWPLPRAYQSNCRGVPLSPFQEKRARVQVVRGVSVSQLLCSRACDFGSRLGASLLLLRHCEV